MTDKILVTTTCASEEEAARVAGAAVEARLAACAQIMPGLTSVYRWKGAVERSAEWQVTFKTRRALFERLAAAIRAAHSYEVPEIVATPVVDGWGPYLEWMDKELPE